MSDLEERLVDCARQAERVINSSLFGDRSPTREECGEEIEQRYRYYQNAQVLETISRAEEKRLIAQGCTREL